MSWKAYTDSLVNHPNNLKYAAIISTDGSMWAESERAPQAQSQTPDHEHDTPHAECHLKPDEAVCIARGFQKPDDMFAAGVKIGGEKYFTLQCNQEEMKLKKGTGGVSICKNVQCCLIGMYDDQVTPGQANNIIVQMADYLKTSGY